MYAVIDPECLLYHLYSPSKYESLELVVLVMKDALETSDSSDEDPEICPICFDKNDPTDPGVKFFPLTINKILNCSLLINGYFIIEYKYIHA